MRRPAPESFIVYGVPVFIAGTCLAAAFTTDMAGAGKLLLALTAGASLLMFWTPARYATALLVTAAWLGRAVGALWGVDDDRIATVALWPFLWGLAVAGILAVHQYRVRDRVLGI